MPRQMPALGTQFTKAAANAVAIAQAGELARAEARPGTAALRELTPPALRLYTRWRTCGSLLPGRISSKRRF